MNGINLNINQLKQSIGPALEHLREEKKDINQISHQKSRQNIHTNHIQSQKPQPCDQQRIILPKQPKVNPNIPPFNGFNTSTWILPTNSPFTNPMQNISVAKPQAASAPIDLNSSKKQSEPTNPELSDQHSRIIALQQPMKADVSNDNWLKSTLNKTTLKDLIQAWYVGENDSSPIFVADLTRASQEQKESHRKLKVVADKVKEIMREFKISIQEAQEKFLEKYKFESIGDAVNYLDGHNVDPI